MISETGSYFSKQMIVVILFVILQTQLPSIHAAHACIDGYCAMSACRTATGSGRSSYCWVAGTSTSYLRCGGKGECGSAANSCKFGSCQFDRAPDPHKEFQKTCSYKNAKMLRELENQCSTKGYSFDSWVAAYKSARDIYAKFQPCTGQLIEEAAKKVIKFCYCYNHCGTGQVYNGCEVNGLEGRLDLAANLFSSYSASCRIDCKPKDKLQQVGRHSNMAHFPSEYTFKVSQGTTTTKGSSTGGSSSHSVSVNVGLNLKSVFSADLGFSQTTSYDWNESSSTSFSKTVGHEVKVTVPPQDTVTIYQVVGICDNSDGNKYVIETNTLVVKGTKSGSHTMEVN